MDRKTRFVAISLALLAAAAPAAQAPKPRVLKGWGQVADPAGDCTIEPVGDKAVTITVPATLHDLSAELEILNAPVILAPVEGDFVAEVRISGRIQPAGPCTRPRGIPFQGAGLLVWQDEAN